jgi:glycosyltransferase involved in cell wall biosynthesis
MLCTINSQVNIPFECLEVIIVNDGTEPLDDSFLTKYNNLQHHTHPLVPEGFSSGIKYFKKPNREGPGPTRQYGIDRATGEYIMLFDADDMLFGVTSLYKFFNVLHTTPQDLKIDVIQAKHCQSNLPTDFKTQVINGTFLYPKAIRRQFLVENNIRFAEDTFMFDDVYFMGLLHAHQPKAVELDEILYMRVVGQGKFSLMSDHQTVEHVYLYAYVETSMKLIRELKKRNLDFVSIVLSEFSILYYHYNKILSLPTISKNIANSFIRALTVFKKFLVEEFPTYKAHLNDQRIFKNLFTSNLDKLHNYHDQVTFPVFAKIVENFSIANYDEIIQFKPTYNTNKKYPYLYNIGLYEVNEKNDKIEYFNFIEGSEKDSTGDISDLPSKSSDMLAESSSSGSIESSESDIISNADFMLKFTLVQTSPDYNIDTDPASLESLMSKIKTLKQMVKLLKKAQ